MKKEITWTTKTNQTAKVTITLTISRIVDLDGRKHEVIDPEISYRGTVDGHDMGGYRVQKINHPVLAACIGKLGILPSQLAEIESAKKDLETHPEYQAMLTREDAEIKAEEMAIKSELETLHAMNR